MTWRPGFSLRTLSVFLLLVTSGTGLWSHWEPWYKTHTAQLEGYPPGRGAACISPDCRKVAVCSLAGKAGIWEADTGRRLFALPKEAEAGFYAALYSTDGKCVYLTGSDSASKTGHRVAEWRPASGALRLVPDMTYEELHAIYYSPDGKRWLNDGRDGLLLVTRGGSSEWVTLRSKGDRWRSGRFSADGRRVVCGAIDHSATEARPAVRIYDSSDGTLIHVLEHRGGLIQSTAFSADGHRILAVTAWGSVLSFRRRRPEWWWGVLWLWEFWLTVAFAGVFVWSVWRDRRALGKEAA